MAADTATVIGFQQRDVFGRLSSGPSWLKPLCLLVSCMFVEHFAHRLQQRPNTHPVLRFASITSSIPAVDVQVRVGEEGVPCDVHVEREPVHVDIVESGDTDADKPLAQCGDEFVVMSNLLIPGPAFGSGFASKHDHQRSLGLPSGLACFAEAAVPTVSGHVGRGGCCEQCNGEQDEYGRLHERGAR